MSQRLKQLIAKKDEKIARAEAVSALAAEESRELTAEESTEIDACLADSEKLTADIDRETKLVNATKSRLEAASKVIASQKADDVLPQSKIVVPSNAVRGKLNAFKDEKDAYLTGQWFAAAFLGNEKARDWCNAHSVPVIRAAHSTGDNTKGGFLVPDSLESTLIRLVQEYGVFRRNVGRVWPMPSGSTKVPKRNGGFTTYYVGENSAITASDMAFAQVQLSAKKLGVLTQISSELMEDSALMLADIIATEFAYAFANAEDEAGFNGDGTSTYGGIVGLENALAAGSIVTTASNVDTFAKLTIATIHDAMSRLPQYPGISPKWYMNSVCWAAAFERLALASSGNTTTNYGAGMAAQFLGKPVEFAQVLPGTSADTDHSGSIFAYYGDLSMACAMGDSRGMTMTADGSVYFTSDALALKATERYDINVHDAGTASVAGSIVALKFNAA